MALLLGILLHVEVTDQAEEKRIDKVRKGPNPSRPQPTRGPVLLDHDHGKQEFAERTAVETFADCFKNDRAEQGKNKQRQARARLVGKQSFRGSVLQGCDYRHHNPHQKSRADTNEVMDNHVNEAGPSAGPEANARQGSGLTRVAVEGRKMDTFWLWRQVGYWCNGHEILSWIVR